MEEAIWTGAVADLSKPPISCSAEVVEYELFNEEVNPIRFAQKGRLILPANVQKVKRIWLVSVGNNMISTDLLKCETDSPGTSFLQPGGEGMDKYNQQMLSNFGATPAHKVDKFLADVADHFAGKPVPGTEWLHCYLRQHPDGTTGFFLLDYPGYNGNGGHTSCSNTLCAFSAAFDKLIRIVKDRKIGGASGVKF